MKRSKKMSLVLMASVSGAMATGCVNPYQGGPTSSEIMGFANANACKTAEAPYSDAQCEQAFLEAQRASILEAPGFDTKEECEQEFNAVHCATRYDMALASGQNIPAEAISQSTESGGGYVPFMWGYMMGQNSSYSRLGHPLIRHKNGSNSSFIPLAPGASPVKAMITNPNGQKMLGTAYTQPAKAVPTAYRVPTYARTHASSRGGFGGRSGGWGG